MEKETWRENKSEEGIKEMERKDAKWRRDEKIREIKKKALSKVVGIVLNTMESKLGRTRTLELARKGLVLRSTYERFQQRERFNNDPNLTSWSDYLKSEFPMKPWLKKSLEKEKQAVKNEAPESEIIEPLSPEEEVAMEPINEAIEDFNKGVDGLVESSDEEIDKL